MLRLIRVTGISLEPVYREGDFVLALKIPFFVRPPRPGEAVIFRHPDYGLMIKQVQSLTPDGEAIFVVGTHPDSTDSRKFGPISKDDLLGRVIWHIRKPMGERAS